MDSDKEWKAVLPKDTILIYILNKDTVDSNNWEIIKTKNKILERFTLSVRDIERLEYTVTYP